MGPFVKSGPTSVSTRSAPAGTHELDLKPSAGASAPFDSARGGFLPIPIEHVPVRALANLPVYLGMAASDNAAPGAKVFTLYRAAGIPFTADDRRALLEGGIKYVYIRTVDHTQFRSQTESQLKEVLDDPTVALSEACLIVYETSVALIDDILSDLTLLTKSNRLENVSRAITTLAIKDPRSFSYVLEASNHDFYTATHMVNVGTWMVPLAYRLGHREPEELKRICQAGLLHDIGKVHVTPEILNKKGALTEKDWEVIRQHPQQGHTDLSVYKEVDPTVLRIVLEHHERLDGSGYPRGLTRELIDPISKICAVVDSFDAMTAFRPFKQDTLTPEQALDVLKAETPQKYDPHVVEAWLGLVTSARTKARPPDVSGATVERKDRRRQKRVSFHCPGRVEIVNKASGGTRQLDSLRVTTHNISRAGLGLLSPKPIRVGEIVQVFLNVPSWPPGRFLRGQVVRCRAHSDGAYDIGVQLSALLDRDAEQARQ
jgi:HD-GYP domain-containing protein (c-di-GMP phosphodiesterase class II)